MKKTLIFIFILLIATFSFAQNEVSVFKQDSLKKDSIQKELIISQRIADYNILRKGRLSISWGWNRATYGRSTIRFWGEGYDFKILKVVGKDRPTHELKTYFHPTKLTIPQYNFRVGYFISNKLSVSFNVDHMKYVLDNSQIATVHGTIDSSASEEWAGNYDNKLMEIKNDFVKFEHTDGLNYLTAELDYNSIIHDAKNFSIDLIAGVGVGAVVPKTNAILFNTTGADTFHWAGVGLNGQIGARFYFYKRFFVSPMIKVGYLYMPNIATNGLEIDKASQKITFFEKYITFGYQMNIFSNK